MSQITSSPGDRSVGDATAEPYPFASRFAVVDGHRMHYIDEGPRDADATMLMVHGNPTWSFYYRRLVSHFLDRVRCVAVDHIGCGLSDKPQQYRYTLAQHIDNLESLIDQCDLRNVTLVAHDWGGAIAMGAAVRVPDRMSRFVLSNTAAFRSTDIPRSIHLVHIPLFGAMMVRGLNAFVRAALDWTVVNKTVMTPAIKAGYKAPYGSWHDRIAVLRFVQDIPLKSSHVSYNTLKEIEEGLPQFADHPIQFIWGEQDFCFTTKFLDQFEEIYPKANTLRLPEAGHYLFEDADEKYRGCIREFLNSHPLNS